MIPAAGGTPRNGARDANVVVVIGPVFLKLHSFVIVVRRGRLRSLLILLVSDLCSEVMVLFSQGLWQRQCVLRVHRRRGRLGKDATVG